MCTTGRKEEVGREIPGVGESKGFICATKLIKIQYTGDHLYKMIVLPGPFIAYELALRTSYVPCYMSDAHGYVDNKARFDGMF